MGQVKITIVRAHTFLTQLFNKSVGMSLHLGTTCTAVKSLAVSLTKKRLPSAVAPCWWIIKKKWVDGTAAGQREGEKKKEKTKRKFQMAILSGGN